MSGHATPPRDLLPPDGFVLLGTAAPSAPQDSSDAGRLAVVLDDADPEGLSEEVLGLSALLAELEPIRPEQVVLALRGAVGARLADRAAFLGMIPPQQAEAMAEERDWNVLLGLGLTASQVGLLVQSEPWLPPVKDGVSFCAWLVEQGVLQQEQVEELHELSLQRGWPLFKVALEQGVLDPDTCFAELARFSGLELASAPAGVPRSVIINFPLGWVEHFPLVPLGASRGVTRIAVPRPLPEALLARLVADLGGPVEQQLASPSDVSTWRRRWLWRWRELHRPVC